MVCDEEETERLRQNKARKKWRELKRWHLNQQQNPKPLVSWNYSQHFGEVVETIVKKVCEYLNMVVDEVRWSDRLNHYTHGPRDPLHRLIISMGGGLGWLEGPGWGET